MKNLFFILGRSGVGKDSIVKELLSSHIGELTNLTPYTSRPKRPNETDGVEYNFVSSKEFNTMMLESKFLEARVYGVISQNCINDTWYYGTPKPDNISKNIISITTYGALNKILSDPTNKDVLKDFNITIIYITATPYTILKRAIEREHNNDDENYRELCRRFIADSDDFENLPSKLEIIANKQIYISSNKCDIHIVDTTNMTLEESYMVVNDILIDKGVKT